MRVSLVYKFIFSFSAFILAIVVVLVLFSYDRAEKILKEQISRNLANIAEISEGQIFLIFENFKIRTSDWSTDAFIKNKFEEILKSGDSQKITELSDYLKNKKQVLDSNIMITDIFNLDGVALVSSFKTRIGHAEPEEELNEEYRYDKAKNASYGESFASSLIYEEEEGHLGHPMWHVSVPIFSEQSNEKIGVMVNHILGDEFYKVLSGKQQVEKGAKTGELFFKNWETSEIYLVNDEKLMITPSRFVKDAVLRQKADTIPVKKCLEENQEFFGEYENYLGEKVFGASMCLFDYKLVLLAEIGREEIFTPLKNEKNNAILIAGSLWLLSVVIIYGIVKFFLKNILIIQKTILEAGRGNFNVKTDVKSSDETGDLASAFNSMIDNIKTSQKQIKEADAKLKEINLSLEQKIKERTAELEKLKVGLEQNVAQKTAELHQKLAELEKFKKLTIGRELKMIELKQEIAVLKNQAGK